MKYSFSFSLCMLILSMAFLSCSSARLYDDSGSTLLKENEGIVVFRVHNPHAGMEGWYTRKNFGDAWETKHLLSLHSEVVIARPGRFYSVENSQMDQLVCIVLPKGTYIVDKIGRNSWHDTPDRIYQFSVEPGCVSYVGDFFFELYLGASSGTGIISMISDIGKGLDTELYDWYSLEVRSLWQETQCLLYAVHPELEVLPVKDVSYDRESVMPSSCWGERAEVRMGNNQPVYQKDGVWYFTLEPL